MILSVGEALVDLVVASDGSVVATPGGGPFNAARAAARAGAQVEFAGALSIDPYGVELRRCLLADGVGVRFCTSSSLPTTVARAHAAADGDATYEFSTDGTTVPSYDPSAVRGELGPLFTGGLALALEPAASRLAAVLEGDGPGRMVMIDVNCRPAAITRRDLYIERIERALAVATIVKASEDDLAFLAPGREPEEVAAHMLELGARAVVVTRGDGAASAHVGAATVRLPAARPPGPVVDTVGAGDTFSGVLLAGLVRSEVTPPDIFGEHGVELVAAAARDAHRAAAIVVTRRGADPPTAAEFGLDG